MKLELKNITGGYPGSFMMTGISLEAPSGSFTGIVGPNGSGKSTLLKIMAGIIKPETGTVFAGENNIADMTYRARARVMAYLPAESPADFPFTVLETVIMGRNPYTGRFYADTEISCKKALSAMEMVGISNLKERVAGSLSSGEKQKVMIARAVCQEPEIMLLDEPASHLDIHHQKQVFGLLKEINLAGVTVIAVLHDLNFVSAYCDRAAVIKDGKIYKEGENPHEIIKKDLLEKIYGKGVRVEKVKGKKYVLP